MTDYQKGYKAFFDGVILRNDQSEEWVQGWHCASDDLEASTRMSYDHEHFEFGDGDVV